MHPGTFVHAVTAAVGLGFESAWFPEHLVLPGAGVDRLVMSPWARTGDGPDAPAMFAGRFLG